MKCRPRASVIFTEKSLGLRWGTRIADLFGRTWDSQDLSSCPTFGEWLIALSSLSEEEVVEEAQTPVAAAAHDDDTNEARSETVKEVPAEIMASLGIEPGTREVNDNVVGRLFHQARDLEDAGNLSGALEISAPRIISLRRTVRLKWSLPPLYRGSKSSCVRLKNHPTKA